jgi:hypothetical protein
MAEELLFDTPVVNLANEKLGRSSSTRMSSRLRIPITKSCLMPSSPKSQRPSGDRQDQKAARSQRRWQEALEAKGHGPRSCGQQPLPALGRRWQGLRTGWQSELHRLSE